MQVTRIEGMSARCAARGVERDVSLFHDQDVKVGDFVLIHLGYAIQTLSSEEAESSWELFDQLLAETEAESDA